MGTPAKMRPFVFLLIAAASATAKPYDADEWGDCMALCKGDVDCQASCDTYMNAVGESGDYYDAASGDYYDTASGDYYGTASGNYYGTASGDYYGTASGNYYDATSGDYYDA